MEKYKPEKIEKKWQGVWEKKHVFRALDKSKKPKYYVLVEFPYPSGEGLHVGHCRSYIGLDVLARKRRMQGFNVLFPMGWDAFGLPTENYAIKTGISPAIATKKNTEVFKRQQKNLGLSFDWNREINTTDPEYYKWTQWIFVQLFKQGLAYKAKMPINWCPACKIGLANEEVIDAKCERCGEKVIRKYKEQWMLKITKYAERLLQDLDKVDYPERVKAGQREWIGRSEGVEIKFKIQNSKLEIPVFTTRPETIFGCTYLVLAPGHSLAKELSSKSKAINPVNNKKIPIFVADYVLTEYGTGAIMAVPGHDERDFDFAKKYNLPIIKVIHPYTKRGQTPPSAGEIGKASPRYGVGVHEEVLINSGRFTGMKSEQAKERILDWLTNKDKAKKTVNYKLRDWIFSRQRYWGEPIPMINCEKCARLPGGQGWIPVPEKDLPVKLPKVKNYKPTEKGESPLAKAKNWVKVKCPKCGSLAQRETDVMPNWAGSNWYYLAYIMPRTQNSKLKTQNYIWDKKKMGYWMPVDWYNGGMEHTTLHLLYSRFIFKFLWDIKAIPKEVGLEPYKKRTSHGMVLGEGGIKMSKSKGNVINPEEVIKEYGADIMRVYEMFMGPFEQIIPWDTKGMRGVERFLQRVWKLQQKVNPKSEIRNPKQIQKTIKKVSEDIENLKFNTAVSALMILANKLEKQKEISLIHYSLFLILLSPFAPHISEELWQRAKLQGLCCEQKWPKYKPKLIKEKKITLVIQINGKVRAKIEVKSNISKKGAKLIALKQAKVLKYTKGKKIKKTIFVKGKLINFVL